MTTAEQMKLVFHLGKIGISLPVDHLVEIIQNHTDNLVPCKQDAGGLCLGTFDFRGRPLELFDLSRLLRLSRWSGRGSINLLVLSGSGGDWAVPVDELLGVFPEAAFSPLTVSPLLEHLAHWPGLAFEQWQNELLLCGDAGIWERLRG